MVDRVAPSGGPEQRGILRGVSNVRARGMPVRRDASASETPSRSKAETRRMSDSGRVTAHVTEHTFDNQGGRRR